MSMETERCSTCGGMRPLKPITNWADVSGLSLCKCTTWIAVSKAQRLRLREELHILEEELAREASE